MATAPTFTSAVRHDWADISAANTNRNGSGTIVTVATGVAAGTRVDEIVIQATGTTTAGMVRLYVSVDNGATWRLFDEVPVVAVVPSASLAAFRVSRTYLNLRLRNATMLLGAAPHNAETFTVHVEGGDLT